jgi:hypothetical protein
MVKCTNQNILGEWSNMIGYDMGPGLHYIQDSFGEQMT